MADLTYDTLHVLRKEHPGWRLLCSEYAPLILSFLHRSFILPNVRTLPEPDLAEALEDDLFGLRERFGQSAFPRSARDYLNEWAAPEKGWLRKFYLRGTDEPHFDLVPATERVITWLAQLNSRSFVGTESRLLTLFDLLRQMGSGSQTDPHERLADLHRRRDALDEEIRRTQDGHITLLDDTALRDRFQQFTYMARDLLSDFREVEHNFRLLDRSVRERIALWEGGKANLLEEILGRREAIDESDQGRSFRGFWEFLMSHQRQQELTTLLDTILDHPAIRATMPEPRLRRVHYDWLQAGDHTQRTVADLSKQLRRFLDDQAWIENRRIMDLLRGIETKALAVRHDPPSTPTFFDINGCAPEIQLPFERTLFAPTFRPTLEGTVVAASESSIDASLLFAVRVVDKVALATHIRQSLHTNPQVTLFELIQNRPLEHGLAEVIAYLELASNLFTSTVDESCNEILEWQTHSNDPTTLRRSVRIPRIIFVR
ncbi:MAG: hypothetical protein RIS92_787 [Verrucomicrobiota bacterium]|jgi:hypothetical protein